MATTFDLVLLYLLAAVAGVVACRTLKLPPILGYLLVGVLIGRTRSRWRRTRAASSTSASSAWCS